MKTIEMIFVLTTVFLAQSVMAQGNGNGVHPAIEYRVMGFTLPYAGAINEFTPENIFGVQAMHAKCSAQVAPNARAAFSDEWMRSSLPAGAPSEAWVVPAQPTALFLWSILFDGPGPDVMPWVGQDLASGVVGSPADARSNPADALGRFACGGYTMTGSLSGLVGQSINGRIRIRRCNIPKPIACSIPVDVAVEDPVPE